MDADLQAVLDKMYQKLENLENTMNQRFGVVEDTMNQRFDAVEEHLSNLQSQANTLEHQLLSIQDTLRLSIRQTSADTGEIRIEVERLKEKVGLS